MSETPLPPKPANGPNGRPSPGRRRFLGASGAAVAAAVAPIPLREAHAAQAVGANGGRRLDLPLLRALAEAALPTEIGEEGVREALRDFVRWLDGFEPVAELPHPYLSSDEVRYGPPDPAPRWASQLEALDLLAEKSRGARFADLPVETRRELVAADLDRYATDEALPAPAYAPHLAVGLLARFYSRPAAADLAYGAHINAAGCRDLASGAVRPAPLPAAAAAGRS